MKSKKPSREDALNWFKDGGPTPGGILSWGWFTNMELENIDNEDGEDIVNINYNL